MCSLPFRRSFKQLQDESTLVLRGNHLLLNLDALLRLANRRRASLSAGSMVEMFKGRPIIYDG